MAGCRPLSDEEVFQIAGKLSTRNKAIFILGVNTGYRIAELLSLSIEDVADSNGQLKDFIKVKRANVKGETEGRVMVLNPEAKKVLREYLKEYPGFQNEPLFRSLLPNGRVIGRLNSSVFHRALKDACEKAMVSDRHLISTHSMKKTFAKNFYDACGKDIYLLQKALGHSHISITARYLSTSDAVIFNHVMGFKQSREISEDEKEIAEYIVKNAKY